MTHDDETRLARAVELAAEARAHGDAPFGSVLVDADGTTVAEERNTVLSDSDITAHPELKLARLAAQTLSPERASGSTLYTSCQPCEMCSGAIDRSGIGRVVYALSNDQLATLKPSGGFPRVPQTGPALTEAATAVVSGYYT